MQLIHCSYHKCLTVYYAKVFGGLYNRMFRFGRGYRHFRSYVEDFYREAGRYAVASVNNHALDLDRLGGDFRISRFIRDPRDLVVSGYLYHLRGAEKWCNVVDPTDETWSVVRGNRPEGMPAGTSYTTYLQGLGTEEGLLAEIEFRRHHFDSMLEWPTTDPRILVVRYEDLLGDEESAFASVLSHYEVSGLSVWLGRRLARRHAAKRPTPKKVHIRDPRAGQWTEHFTPLVTGRFMERHAGVLERYGYA